MQYLYSKSLCDYCCKTMYYDAFSRAPVLTRLSNITEVEIVVGEEAEHLLKDILMRLKVENRLTLSNISNIQNFLLPLLKSRG